MTFHFEQGYFVSCLWNTVDYLIGVIAMIYVGIDVASEKHDCCILNPKGKPIHYFTFANSEQGFSLLQQELLHHASPEQIRVGLEATGIYGTNLQSFLRRMGVEATTLNPLLLKNNIKGTTLRKTKTDKEDAIAIAAFLWKEGLQPDLPVSYHISELKSLTRSRFSLVQCRTRAKVQAKGVLQVLFPEFKNLFADTFGASARAVLKTYPSAKAIAAADTDKLAELLCSASRGRFGRAKAEQLMNCAAHSIATYSDAQSMILVMHLEQIEFFSAQIDKVESQIKAHLLQINSPIMTIPGIGLVLGATILAEVGDIKRFSSPAKLLSYAGLEPSVYQSGKYKASSGRMVKRGSPILRWALIQAARMVPQHEETFAAYLSKKQGEGKHFNIAVSHCAKKLVRVIFAILNKNTPFSRDYIRPTT